MTTPSFTPEEFKAAIAALIQKGIRPTVRKLRQVLGRGSHETIGPMLADWRAEQEAPAMTTAVPAAVQAKAAECAALVWATANAQARAELDALRQRLQQQHAELVDELADARLDVSELEMTVANLQKQLEHERLLREDESRRRADAEGRCNRLAEIESAVAWQRDQIERLQAELANKSTEATHNRAVAETLRQQMNDLLKTLGTGPSGGDGNDGGGTTRPSPAKRPSASGRREQKTAGA
jgi:uncharacterized coiled-coil protein SlyX